MHYNYDLVLPFEKDVDAVYEREITQYSESIYYPYAFLICAVYMLGIFLGQRYMAKRAEFKLRTELIVWNIFLSLFSIMGAIRFLPDFLATLAQDGFFHSICVADYTRGVPGWWCVLFTVSKVFELGDTVFLVLRKRDVIFLHWYHHVTVLLYTWYGFNEMAAAGRWFIAMNYAVHAVMYPYYLARALGFRLPKWVPVTITTGQLSQMFMGCAIMLVIVYTRVVSGTPCRISNTCLVGGSLMYTTYMLLFMHFFYQAYIKRRPSQKASVEGKGKENGSTHLSNGIAVDDRSANGHIKVN